MGIEIRCDRRPARIPCWDDSGAAVQKHAKERDRLREAGTAHRAKASTTSNMHACSREVHSVVCRIARVKRRFSKNHKNDDVENLWTKGEFPVEQRTTKSIFSGIASESTRPAQRLPPSRVVSLVSYPTISRMRAPH